MEPFRIEDLFQQTVLAEMQGASGHTRLVFSGSQATPENSYVSKLWQLDTASGESARALTTPEFPSSSPALDPQGGAVAFLSARTGGTKQVHVLQLDGGEARQLGQSGLDLQQIQQWSPDGKQLLLTARRAWAEDALDDTGAGEDRPWVVNYLPYKLDGSGCQVGYRTLLMMLSTDSGDERVLLEGDFDVTEAQWSPDGQSIAFVRSGEGSQRHLLDVWLADADGGNARQLTRTLASVSELAWSPDGRVLALGGSATEGDSMSELWILDVAEGALRRPVEDLQLEGNTIVWHPQGDRLATVAARRGLQEVVVIDLASGEVTRVDEGLQHASALSVTGGQLAFVTARMDRPDEVHVVGWDGGNECARTSFNQDWIAEKALPRVEKRSFQVPDGADGTEDVDAWLLLPPDSEGPFPLLVDFHGGPQSHVLIDFASHVYWYDLIANGWAIVAANAVGSGSYGTEFARRLCGHWGELDLPQHLAIVDALQQQGVAGKQVACTGKSYGGYLTAWAIGHTQRFARAVISAPVSNLESHAGTSDTGYYVGPYSMDAEVVSAPERYRQLSPISHAASASTPTLFLQGEDDQRCPLGQSEEMFARLVRYSSAHTRMVVYPQGSHLLAGTGQPRHRVDYHRRLSRWVREE